MLKINQNKILLTGDASAKIETILLKYNLNADILKLGYHGSKTSSSLTFLHKLKPKIGIISSEKNNRYNHPSSEIISRLKKLEIKYYNTAKVGTIEFNFRQKNYTINTYSSY